MNGRQNEQLFQISLIVLLCAYVLIGNGALNFGVGYLPSMNFSILAKEPNEVSHYALRFQSINGEPLDEPVFFDDAIDLLDNRNIRDGERLINRLGIALHQADDSTASELHTVLIDEYLQIFESVEYDILLLVVNPVEKYTLETFTSEETIGSFTYSSSNQISYVSPYTLVTSAPINQD